VKPLDAFHSARSRECRACTSLSWNRRVGDPDVADLIGALATLDNALRAACGKRWWTTLAHLLHENGYGGERRAA
jgi:hypothetical protein